MNTRRILKVVVVGLLLGMACTTHAEEDTWTEKAPMPTARFGLSTSVVGGKIYAIGGGKTAYGAYLSTVEEYDPATDTWTKKASMPTARNGHAASVVNGKIYVIGGEPSAQASLPTVEEYDPATDTWTPKADMPTRRTFLCASAVNGKIYAIGGVIAGAPAVPNPHTRAVEEYDPATDTWTKKADMPTQRSCFSASVVDGKIYVIGGETGDIHSPPISSVEEYDPATDTWTRKANMPTARAFPSTSVVDGKINAIGGAVWPGTAFSTVEEYNPTTDTWTRKTDMPTARLMLSTGAVNGKIYAIGGTVGAVASAWAGISTVEEYTAISRVVDFNGDGKVDFKDFSMLAQYWQQNERSVDMAPTPLGDGVVDIQDAAVVAEYWLTEPRLVAHWKLDEREGYMAQDSAGDHDAFVIGPIWQPTNGKVDGALEFDGIDDHVGTPFVLNPGQGSFSVFLWVKAGLPGQMILSQKASADWLYTLSPMGWLMTSLGQGGSLMSQTVVTDGQWHRIGFTWDGTKRILYVDGVNVAEGTPAGLAASQGGLYFGAGKDLDAGSFFSGLIDDIKIYDRAIVP